MDTEKRMIDHWEVLQAVHMGDREIALAVDPADPSPYLVADVTSDALFERYTNTVASEDYLEAMEEYLCRVQRQVEQVKAQRREREAQGVEMLPLGERICLPESHRLDFTGQIIVVKAELLRWEYATPDHQLYYATGGNGCNPDARGTTIFCRELYSGESTAWKRYGILGVADPQQLPDWARERLEVVRQQEAEKARTPPKGRKVDDECQRQ